MTIREYIKDQNITTEEIEILNRYGGCIACIMPIGNVIDDYLDNEIIEAKKIVCHHFVCVGTDYTLGGGMEPIDTYFRYTIRIKTKKTKKA